MDKKYKAIKTLKDLDLSRGTRSSLSSSSGKSNFSSKSKEDRFNVAYLKDFSASPPAKASKASPPKAKARKSSPKATSADIRFVDDYMKKKSEEEEKVVRDFIKTNKPKEAFKTPPKSKSGKASPPKPTSGDIKFVDDYMKKKSEEEEKVVRDFIKTDKPKKVLNPLTGKEVSVAYYKTLVKSGKLSAMTTKVEDFEEAGVPEKKSSKKESPKPESPESPLYPMGGNFLYGLHEYVEDLKEKHKFDEKTADVIEAIEDELVGLYYNNNIFNFKEQLNTLLAKLHSNTSPKVIKSMERNILNLYKIVRMKKKEYYSYLTEIKKVSIK
jgi:hypothetical protein